MFRRCARLSRQAATTPPAVTSAVRQLLGVIVSFVTRGHPHSGLPALSPPSLGIPGTKINFPAACTIVPEGDHPFPAAAEHQPLTSPAPPARDSFARAGPRRPVRAFQ